MALTRNYKASANTRAYIGLTADATDDDEFILLTNETNLEFEFDSESNSDVMKGEGYNGAHKATNPGIKSYTFSVDCAENYDDPGFVLLRAAHGKIWPYQVRELGATDAATKVVMAGPFVAEKIGFSASANEGSRKANASLSSAGVIDTAIRALAA